VKSFGKGIRPAAFAAEKLGYHLFGARLSHEFCGSVREIIVE